MIKNNEINLWGSARVDALPQSPFDFMREQGEALRYATGDRLWGEVVSRVAEDGITYYEFRIASERLGEYRCTLLQVAHAKHVFPLYIYDYSRSDEGLQPLYEYVPEMRNGFSRSGEYKKVKNERGKYLASSPDFVANDFDDFERHFSNIIRSGGTKAIMQSLLLQMSHAD